MVNAEKSTSPEIGTKIEPLEDGFYLILNEFFDSTEIPVHPKGRIVPYSFDFLDSNTSGQALFFEVDPENYVALSLKEAPEGMEQPDARINLMLVLADSSSLDLEEFTGNHINGRVCIIIGGKAVTRHKIREKIVGGRMQISRCTDNACKYLFWELRDNYTPE